MTKKKKDEDEEETEIVDEPQSTGFHEPRLGMSEREYERQSSVRRMREREAAQK